MVYLVGDDSDLLGTFARFRNEERFWLGGAAHGRGGGHEKVGTAPVSQKRVGLNRHAETAMGVVLAGQW
jgi:hypothetical protein